MKEISILWSREKGKNKTCAELHTKLETEREILLRCLSKLSSERKSSQDLLWSSFFYRNFTSQWLTTFFYESTLKKLSSMLVIFRNFCTIYILSNHNNILKLITDIIIYQRLTHLHTCCDHVSRLSKLFELKSAFSFSA